MRKVIVHAMIVHALVFLIPVICHAESAEVLPKGVFSFVSNYYHYFNIKERYDPDGDPEDLAVDFSGNLNSDVFPDLSMLDPFVAGKASIGSSVVSFTRFYRWFEFKFQYGLTDRLSLGVLLPFNRTKQEVKARLDKSTANVGKNPLFGQGVLPAPLDVPLIPIDTTGTPWAGITSGIPLTEEDVQDLLGGGIDVNKDGRVDIPGFGFKRFETWSDKIIGDIEIGAKYKFYNRGDWRFAFASGVRLPTGKVDDPDNLIDLASGDGQTDILFRLYADYVGIKNLLLNGTIYYDLQLPDKQKLRVPEDVNQPITTNKEKVSRNLGDVIEFEVMANYSFTPEVSGGVIYRYSTKFKDHVTGDRGFAYSSLEDETRGYSHMYIVTIGYSTIQKYLDKKFPLPLSASISYRNRFAGTNNVTKSEYVSLSLAFYF